MKRTIVAILLAASAAFFMSGCANMTPQSAATYGLEAAQAAQAILTAKVEVVQAEGILLSNSSVFSAQEMAQLNYTDTQVNAAIALVDGMTKGGSGQGTTVLLNLAQLTQTYNSTKAAYLAGRTVVQNHIASFTPAQHAQLDQLDASMQAIDAAVQQLANAPSGTNVTPLIVSALQVAALTAKIALAVGA